MRTFVLSKSKNKVYGVSHSWYPVHLQDCELVYNGHEIGMPENPDPIHLVERIPYTTREGNQKI